MWRLTVSPVFIKSFTVGVGWRLLLFSLGFEQKQHMQLLLIQRTTISGPLLCCIVHIVLLNCKHQPSICFIHSFCVFIWPPRFSVVAAHLFVQTLQLHLQVLQEALPLNQLALSSSQSLVALLHVVLHRLQLDEKVTRTDVCGSSRSVFPFARSVVFSPRNCSPHLLAVPLLSLVLVLLDDPLVLGTQVKQNGAQLGPSGRVHLDVHLISGNARLHLLQFLRGGNTVTF